MLARSACVRTHQADLKPVRHLGSKGKANVTLDLSATDLVEAWTIYRSTYGDPELATIRH
jgi:hypothetical protein